MQKKNADALPTAVPCFFLDNCQRRCLLFWAFRPSTPSVETREAADHWRAGASTLSLLRLVYGFCAAGPKVSSPSISGRLLSHAFFFLPATTSSRRITLHSMSLRSPATSLFAVPMPRARTGGGPRRGGADREAALNFFRPFGITAR
jgi:hypothetical protein